MKKLDALKTWLASSSPDDRRRLAPPTVEPELEVYLSDGGRLEASNKAILRSGHMRGLFSQLGEDGTILWLFEGKRDGFYVDVGCHLPTLYSNTAALHLWHNWRGLNIDIDERAIAAFNQWRPHDINVHAGVAAQAGRMETTIFEAGALSTLDVNASANPAWASVPRTNKMIDVFPLSVLLERHLPTRQVVDFLNIDAEGLDYQVLTSNDWSKYRPNVIAVEVHDFPFGDPTSHPTFSLLTSLGYEMVSHVVITSIYRRR